MKKVCHTNAYYAALQTFKFSLGQSGFFSPQNIRSEHIL